MSLSVIGIVKRIRPVDWNRFRCPLRYFLVSHAPRDCSAVLKQGQTKSGVYRIYPFSTGCRSVRVYCDMETAGGGWTVRSLSFSSSLSPSLHLSLSPCTKLCKFIFSSRFQMLLFQCVLRHIHIIYGGGGGVVFIVVTRIPKECPAWERDLKPGIINSISGTM
jgi:hypothetical protein